MDAVRPWHGTLVLDGTGSKTCCFETAETVYCWYMLLVGVLLRFPHSNCHVEALRFWSFGALELLQGAPSPGLLQGVVQGVVERVRVRDGGCGMWDGLPVSLPPHHK
jgi:hypothetical protein